MKSQYLKVTFVIIIIAIIFIARLAYLQLFTDRYALNAANTSIKKEYVIPQRGVIFDRNGKILVGNQPSYEISFTEALMKPDFDTIGFCKLVNITKPTFIRVVKGLKKEKYFSKLTPITFMKNISREEIARIQEIIFRYPAFSIVRRPQRQYEISTSGNLLGFTNQVNDYYIKRDSTYYLPGDIAGMSGIEKSYEKELRGKKGINYIQKDIRLRNIGPYKAGKLDIDVVTGKDLTLTIDYDLQKLAEEMLVNKRGAVVAIDPKTGEILTLATGPDIDPNVFTGPNKTKELYKLQMDSFNMPSFDRSIQAAYPPGSTFKLLTALAALQMGVITPETVFPCGGGFNYKGVRIKGHGGAIPLIPSIQVSSNCYFSYAYLAILNKYPGNPSKSIDEWAKIMHSFGLGQYLNNDLATGSAGLIPDSKFYEKRYGKNWKPIQAVFNGMGQGDILITPIQIANFTAAIANKGYYYTPHIVKLIDGKPNPDPRFKVKHQTLVDKKYFDYVLKGMEQVMVAGTGRSLKSADFTQLAKTGTAQVPQGKDNSIFTLIAPAENPKIVVASVMEHAGFGATWAGPASSVIAEKYVTGTVKRDYLIKKMFGASFMGEYKRQWIEYLKKIGKYVPPKPDSIQLKKKQDSLRLIFNKNLKLEAQKKEDSAKSKTKKK
ncbi:penicillin-binding transpeptidase domain-containing protein [Halpernia sp.]|uniref:penicillin-binding transpeptidase domain-containing protein n=1 Tax=Halpernia sp. TaxID=2782209 RepID=UPI003A93A561